VARQRAGELASSEGELVIARTALDELHDQLYVLACAVADTESDLGAVDGAPTAAELRRMLDWLLEAARPLAALEVPASECFVASECLLPGKRAGGTPMAGKPS
jgi:hypothetical protein